MSRRSAAIAILALATTGCFPVAGEAELVMEEEVHEVTLEPLPLGDADVPGAGTELVEPTPGMFDVRPVPWDEAQVDGNTVTVSWWSGMAPCDVLDRVEVVEGDDEVVITLVEGDAEPAPSCRLAAQRKSTAVELEEPVGQRSLVDGTDAAS